jgi:hypothetical protein
MMTRLSLKAAASLTALAACTSPAPYEQQVGGVGFGSYSEYQAQREASLNSGLPNGPGPVNPYGPSQNAYGALPPAGQTTPGGLPPSVIAAVDAAQPGAQPLQPIAPLPSQQAPVAGTPGVASAAAAAARPVNNSGISDENDFNAVASRETIESDKARIEANKAQYVQIAPGALPERTDTNAVSPVIEYAINAPNRLGESIYDRGGIALGSTDKACARYSSSAAAQEAFLKAGGPKRDPKNLDPDGDGFACRWDPTPFQKARG